MIIFVHSKKIQICRSLCESYDIVTFISIIQSVWFIFRIVIIILFVILRDCLYQVWGAQAPAPVFFFYQAALPPVPIFF